MTTQPVQKRSAATRERLLDAAAEIFIECGYERSTVADIARRASVTTGAIYSNYRGKAELLLEVIRTRLQSETDSFQATVRSSPDINKAILELIGASRNAGRSETRALILESFAVARRDAAVRKVIGDLLTEQTRFLASRVRFAQQEGIITQDVPPSAIAWLYTIPAAGEAFAEAAGLDLLPLESWLAAAERMMQAFASAPTDSSSNKRARPAP